MVGFALDLISRSNKESHISKKMSDFSVDLRKIFEPENQEEVIS